MPKKAYENQHGDSPIISYNVIRSRKRGVPDKVIVEYGRDRSRSTSYTFTSLTIGSPNFEALVGALEDGVGAARHVLFNIDGGAMGGGVRKSRRARHTRKVSKKR